MNGNKYFIAGIILGGLLMVIIWLAVESYPSPLSFGLMVSVAPVTGVFVYNMLKNRKMSGVSAKNEEPRATPFVSLHFERDSVCMGDDCDAPHQKTLQVSSMSDLRWRLENDYLPHVMGDVSWYAHSSRHVNDVLFKIDWPLGGLVRIYDMAYDDLSFLPRSIFLEYKGDMHKP